MGVQDRDWYHEHRDHVAASDRQRSFRVDPPLVIQPRRNFGVWHQLGLFVLICLAVLGALFLVVFVRAHWLR